MSSERDVSHLGIEALVAKVMQELGQSVIGRHSRAWGMDRLLARHPHVRVAPGQLLLGVLARVELGGVKLWRHNYSVGIHIPITRLDLALSHIVDSLPVVVPITVTAVHNNDSVLRLVVLRVFGPVCGEIGTLLNRERNNRRAREYCNIAVILHVSVS